ncbi:hypothetical protein HMPREF9997_01799 [Corynebacterium durum F0235]|uniref:Uncharacterized protein n=1 Tax=Corynebacterium durum F0235 TaxID=1035195 RepID=L1MES2_9CORY|nr:hypothetical protein HMPREF9997_01799 [Corynebacterium durum F0235]
MGLFLFLLIDAATPLLVHPCGVSGFRGVMLGGIWAVLFFSFAIAFSLFLLVKIKFYSK